MVSLKDEKLGQSIRLIQPYVLKKLTVGFNVCEKILYKKIDKIGK